MRAIVAAPDTPNRVRFEDVSEPEPHSSEAVVEVHAVSLNRGELRRLKAKPAGWRPGWDIAGVVKQAARNGSGPPVGARVVGLVYDHGWAELVSVMTKNLAILPDACDFSIAASLPVAGLTALRALARGGLLLSKEVLVTGASGGVGHFAVQLAKHSGASVSALVGGTRPYQDLHDLGADIVMTPDQFAKSQQTYDVVIESVGGDTLTAAIRSIRPDAKVIVFGNSSQGDSTIQVSNFYGRASGSEIVAFELFHELERTHSCTNDLQTLARLVTAGTLKSSLALELPWRDVGKALQALEDRHLPGKIVLRVR